MTEIRYGYDLWKMPGILFIPYLNVTFDPKIASLLKTIKIISRCINSIVNKHQIDFHETLLNVFVLVSELLGIA